MTDKQVSIAPVPWSLDAELDLQTILQRVTDAGTSLTQAEFGAFFYNTVNEYGESLILFTLSGASREEFERFGVPRNTELFGPTFRGESTIRLGDVQQDPHYDKNAPFFGMPEGDLPVRSYLAVPVVSRSESVLGGLFFGHSQPHIFDEESERAAVELAGRAAVAIDNALLFGEAKKEFDKRAKTEVALRESEERYRQLVNGLPAAAYTCDAEGRIELFNDAAVDLWGSAPKAGATLWDGCGRLYRPDGSPLPRDECPMVRTLRSGEAIRGEELLIERPDGTRRNVLAHPEPIFDSSGQLVGTVNMLLDITDQQQTHADRELLAAIVEFSEDAIVSKTLDGIITSWNHGAERIFGYTAEEVVGQSITMLIPQERLSEETAILQRLRSGQRIEHFETVRVSKGGRYVNVSLTVSPMRNAAGEIVGASKVARDISHRIRQEHALRQSESKFRTLASHAPVGIFQTDLDGNTTFVNNTWCNLAGLPPAKAEGEGWARAIHPQDRDRVVSGWRAAVERGQASESEFRFCSPDGSIVWVHGKAEPLRSKNGKLTGYIGTIADITSRKLAEEAVRESEARFRTMADNISQFAWMTDHEGQIFWYNRRWFDYTGTTLDEVAGWGWRKVHHPDHVDRVVKKFRDCIQSGEVWEDTFPLRGKDGQYRWFLSRAMPIRNEQGRVERWFGTNTDITDQLEAEAAVRESEERFRTMADTAPAVIWITDQQNECTFLSRGWYDYTGQSEDEGLDWIDATHPQDREEVKRKFHTASQRQEPFTIDSRLRRYDGTYRWAIASARPRFDSDGKWLGYIGSVIDAHERKQAEQALRELNDTLELRVASRTAELGRRTRLLRQLANQLTATEQSERKKLAQSLHDGLQQILVAIKMQLPPGDDGESAAAISRVQELLDDAIATSRSLAYDLSPPTLHDSDLPDAVKWLVRWFADNHRHTVELVTDHNFPAMPEQAKVFLFSVIRELLLNSVKHSGTNQSKVQLKRSRRQEVRVIVSDQGRGFDTTELSQDQHLDGLGLFSIRERLAALGGRFDVSSAPGKGSRFVVDLPNTDVSFGDTAAENGEQSTRRDDQPAGPSPDDLVSVLIVDDHQIVRDGLATMLREQADLRIAGEASNGQEAINQVQRLRPAIVIMDINMPQMDGIEATRRIKARHPEVKIIGLSLHVAEDKADAMLKAGATVYLRKDEAMQTLLQTIRNICESQDFQAIASPSAGE